MLVRRVDHQLHTLPPWASRAPTSALARTLRDRPWQQPTIAMRSATALVVVLLAAAHGYQEVHEIDTHTFDLKVREGVWLLMWYAPWCGHCKKMQPIFEEVAEYYHRRDDQVRVGRIDGTAHTGLASNAGVKGYPTLLLLRDGETIDEYKGPRTFEAITAFVDGTSNEPPSSTKVEKSSVPIIIFNNKKAGLGLGNNESISRRRGWWSRS